VRSLIYSYDPETMHEAAESRVRVDSTSAASAP